MDHRQRRLEGLVELANEIAFMVAQGSGETAFGGRSCGRRVVFVPSGVCTHHTPRAEIGLTSTQSSAAIDWARVSGYAWAAMSLERGVEFYRTLLENAFEGIAIVDGEGKIIFQNKAAAQTLGADEGALIGASAVELIHPDDVQSAVTSLATLNANKGALLPDAVRMKRQDSGQYVSLETRAVNLSEHPEVRGIVVNFRDVTQQKLADQALRESEERLELAVEASELGLWDWDLETNLIAFDRRAATVLGLAPDELTLSRDEVYRRVHDDDLPTVQDAVQAHLEGTSARLEMEYRFLDHAGHHRWIASRGKVVERSATGKALRVAGTHLDIDQRRRVAEEKQALQDRLQVAQKMESIGQLAGGVAHDFNNILQIVLAHAYVAQQDPTASDSIKLALLEIEKAGERAATLTRQLLALGRRQTLAPRPCDLNRLLESSLSLLRRALPKSIEIDFIPGRNLPAAFVDPAQFEQVFTNLCVNARDAMPDGGRLTVETENVLVNGEYCRKHPWAKAGRYVLLCVSDTGHGMDAETQRQAFDPFFSTKDASKNSGLGLAMVHGIIRQHEGMVHLYSEPALGTTFKLFWPVAERSAQEVGDRLDGPVPRGNETVLIVEDDPGVLRLAAKILRSGGYSVMTASDGEEALSVFRACHAQIDVVILDAVMPKRSGREVYQEIARSHPKPVLFTSGYSAAALPADSLVKEGLDVLPKPYAPDLLLRKVRAVIDHARVDETRE
jgi:PAS domain S-box-containing protein